MGRFGRINVYFYGMIVFFTSTFFTSTEFCITCLIIAAAIVACLCVPDRRSSAREFTYAGELDDDGTAGDAEPTVGVECLDDGTVVLTRTGLRGLTDAGALSLAVTVIGFDIFIEERMTQGRVAGAPVNRATFMLDFAGRERYHLRYNSPATSTEASLTLNNRPGFNARRILKH